MKDDRILIEQTKYDFASRFRRLRAYYNLNQKEFAKYLDLSTATVSRYENGLMKPTLDVSLKIATKCDATLDWLAGYGSPDEIEKRK